MRYLSLSGILTPIPFHETVITPALNNFKQDIFGTTDIILHRREIVRREGPFQVLSYPAKVQMFNTRLLLLLRENPYLLTTIAIDKREHLLQYSVWQFDPYHYCLCCLIERYVSWLRRHNARGDVIIEQRTKDADKKVKASFRRIYEHGTANLHPRAAQTFLTSKEIKFVQKRDNIAGMQICDLLAHPSYRHMKFEREGIPQPDDFGTSIVDILLERRYARDPKNTSKINGWGRKWLPW